MNYRSERIASLIREMLGRLIEKEIETPGALVTITEITIDKKLERARVGLSVIPSEEAGGALKVFQRNREKFQRQLMKKIHIKPMPQIEFEIDYGLEHAANIEKLLLKE